MIINISDNFGFPVLFKTGDTLTYTPLKLIKDQLKANASSVSSELGGRNGHLGLVLTPREYALCSVVPYVRHLNPSPLVIPAGMPAHAATRMRKDHKEQKRLFREMINLEQLLIIN